MKKIIRKTSLIRRISLSKLCELLDDVIRILFEKIAVMVLSIYITIPQKKICFEKFKNYLAFINSILKCKPFKLFNLLNLINSSNSFSKIVKTLLILNLSISPFLTYQTLNKLPTLINFNLFATYV